MKLKLCLYFKAAAVVPLAQKPPTIAGPSLQRAFKASFPTPRLALFVLAELLYTKGVDRVSYSQLLKKKMLTCQCCCGEIARSASHIAPALNQSELLIKLTLRAPLAGFGFFHWRMIKPERSCICADHSAPREAIK